MSSQFKSATSCWSKIGGRGEVVGLGLWQGGIPAVLGQIGRATLGGGPGPRAVVEG